jgi:hypothetical protein
MGNRRSLPTRAAAAAENGCPFQWQQDHAGAKGGYRYRPPLHVDRAGAERLAKFLATHAADGCMLSDAASPGTATLIVSDAVSDCGDQGAAGWVHISDIGAESFATKQDANDGVIRVGGDDGSDDTKGGGDASKSLDLWRDNAESLTSSGLASCVMAHGGTLVFTVTFNIRPSVGDRRTHRVHAWTAVVHLSSRADRVAAHLWPTAPCAVVRSGAVHGSIGWERQTGGIEHHAMSAGYRLCPPHHLAARFPDGSVAVLDIRCAASVAALSAPSFAGWRVYESAEAAFREVPAVGYPLALPHSMLAPLDWRFATRARVWGLRMHADGANDDADVGPVDRDLTGTEIDSGDVEARGSDADNEFLSKDVFWRDDNVRHGFDGRCVAALVSAPEPMATTDDGAHDLGGCGRGDEGGGDSDRRQKTSKRKARTSDRFEAVTHDRISVAFTVLNGRSRVRAHRTLGIAAPDPLPRMFLPPSACRAASLVDAETPVFHSNSVHVVPRSGRAVSVVVPDRATLERLTDHEVRRAPTVWLRVHDRGLTRATTHAFNPRVGSAHVCAVLPNDDVLFSVRFFPPCLPGLWRQGPVLALRPSTGRCRFAFAFSHVAAPRAASLVDALAADTRTQLVWLPACELVTSDRRTRLSTALDVAHLSRVLIELVCAYAAPATVE